MPALIDSEVMIDLTVVGDWVDVPVGVVDQVSVRAADHETWGSGVVEIQKVYGGDSVPYTVAKAVSNATPTQENVAVADIASVRLVVTTAGTGFGRVAINGKETQ